MEGVRERAEKGDILFGTVDTWLLWNLTGGKAHITDYSNASRTMIYNIKTLRWDEKILGILNIPSEILPEVRQSSEIYANTNAEIFGAEIPISGIVETSKLPSLVSSVFRKHGKEYIWYGCFMLMNTGEK